MIINGKCYCDVCLEPINNTSETCFVFSGGSRNNGEQERHYCKDHRVFYDLWQEIYNGEDIGKLMFPKNKVEKNKENKEISNMEVYNIVTKLLQKYLGFFYDCMEDKDITEYWKNTLQSDVDYHRLVLKGAIKDDSQRERTEN